MNKVLVVVDMQNDFVFGALGSMQARAIVPYVKTKIAQFKAAGSRVIFTRDTHFAGYLSTAEGKKLPVPHCIKGTAGHEIIAELGAEGGVGSIDGGGVEVIDKPTFGSFELAERVAEILGGGGGEVELCGVCTDICVVSNALILKTRLPETEIIVDAKACAGVSDESHRAALRTMQMCQITVLNIK